MVNAFIAVKFHNMLRHLLQLKEDFSWKLISMVTVTQLGGVEDACMMVEEVAVISLHALLALETFCVIASLLTASGATNKVVFRIPLRIKGLLLSMKMMDPSTSLRALC